MKLSLNWIKDFVKIPDDMDLKRLAYDLTMSTVEVEDAIDLGKQFDNIIVGEIKEVLPHPNADKLRICRTDIGEGEIKGAVDDCGIRFRDTNFYEFYESTHIFPEDAILALRKMSTVSALTGKSKAERAHAFHTELFKKMADFKFPEGYKPKDQGER